VFKQHRKREKNVEGLQIFLPAISGSVAPAGSNIAMEIVTESLAATDIMQGDELL